MPINFILPQDPKERAQNAKNVKGKDKEVKLVNIKERQRYLRTELTFHQVSEDRVDLDLNVKKMKKKRLSEFRDVFKKDLGPDDRLKIDPVKVPIETTLHLQSIAKEELSRFNKALTSRH